jgi:hypothetical protein
MDNSTHSTTVKIVAGSTGLLTEENRSGNFQLMTATWSSYSDQIGSQGFFTRVNKCPSANDLVFNKE